MKISSNFFFVYFMKAFTFNRVSERFRNKLMNSKIKVT